jgi:hypothetical protein
MTRRVEQRVAAGKLDDLAEVHDGNAVRCVADHGEIVRDEDQRQTKVALQILEQVDDLGADRHVERRDRFIADDETWVGR